MDYTPVSPNFRGAIRRVKLPAGSRKLIALTFDLCEQPGEVAGYDGKIIDYLRAQGIKANRERTVLDTGSIDPYVGKQITALPNGEIFDLSTNGSTFIGTIVARTPNPTPADQAAQAASDTLVRGKSGKTIADKIAELRKAAIVIEQAAWAPLGFLNFTRAHFEYYQQLLDDYADCQLCLVDEVTGYPVAVGNCVPISCDMNDLPPEGWDWIVENAADKARFPRNALGALAISVPGIHRGKGVARRLIDGFRDLAAQKGFDGVVAPVRPSAKQIGRAHV